jgi:hypothetical protein
MQPRIVDMTGFIETSMLKFRAGFEQIPMQISRSLNFICGVCTRGLM